MTNVRDTMKLEQENRQLKSQVKDLIELVKVQLMQHNLLVHIFGDKNES